MSKMIVLKEEVVSLHDANMERNQLKDFSKFKYLGFVEGYSSTDEAECCGKVSSDMKVGGRI